MSVGASAGLSLLLLADREKEKLECLLGRAAVEGDTLALLAPVAVAKLDVDALFRFRGPDFHRYQ